MSFFIGFIAGAIAASIGWWVWMYRAMEPDEHEDTDNVQN